MTTDPLRVPVRSVLARTGDAALPARPWDELVSVPFDDQHDTDRRARWLAAAAVLVVLLGAVGVWRVRSDGDASTFATPPGTARWIAVPLFVPSGMAYDGTVASDATVPGYDGLAAADTVTASWTRGNASLTILSAKDPDGLSPQSGRDEPLVPLQTVTVVEDDGPIVLRWFSPTGSTGTFGLRAVGLTLDEALAVARSAWYVTPGIWSDLSARAGFRSGAAELAVTDPWAPDVVGWDPRDPVVHVRGSLQPSPLSPSGLWVNFLNSGNGFYDAGTPVDRCWGSYVGATDGRQPVALSGDADVVAFLVTDVDGSVTRVPAQEHPGLPAYRFAVTTATPANGVVPVTCETLP